MNRDCGGRQRDGGLSSDSDVRSGGPLVVLYSDDLDSSLAKVREAGGGI